MIFHSISYRDGDSEAFISLLHRCDRKHAVYLHLSHDNAITNHANEGYPAHIAPRTGVCNKKAFPIPTDPRDIDFLETRAT